MIEIRSTVKMSKPIIPVIDPDKSRGGLSLDEVHARLVAADGMYGKWGFADEAPHGEELYSQITRAEPVEWNRIGAFQDVTMRIIASRVIEPLTWPTSKTKVYLKDEISQKRVVVHPPKKRFHIYCSPHVVGSAELMAELGREKACTVMVTGDINELSQCDHFLAYLHGRTWTSGDASTTFAGEVALAMNEGVSILLAHEMIGVGGQEARHGCEFGDFFSSPPDGTPSELLNRGIYSSIAVALKGSEWRDVSFNMLAQALVVEPDVEVTSVNKTLTKSLLANMDRRELVRRMRETKSIGSNMVRGVRSHSTRLRSTRVVAQAAAVEASAGSSTNPMEEDQEDMALSDSDHV
jgi:hypothetical protein